VTVRVESISAERWHDLVAVFGPRGHDASWCWCRRFLDPGPDNRSALRREVEAATVPLGVLAYVDDRPVGWSRVGPRHGFAGVTGNRALARILDDDADVWWTTCFMVERRHRGAGVGHALLAGDVELARRHGASAVEGHPVDVERLVAEKVAASAVFTGTLAMFAAAGFHEIGRTYASRPVMRLDL
jgi:GNAT superfamily N-acetyltransferase